MDQSSSPDVPAVTQPPAWLGPLVAGCCFALGYGITHRVLTLQTNAEDPSPEAFTKLAFPGASLQKIRARFGDDKASLEVDVTALEAANAASRPPEPEVKTTIKPDVALQTPQPPVWTAPAWSDPQSIAPDLQPEVPEADGAEPSTAQEQGPDDSNSEPVVGPEATDVVPAVVVPAAVLPADDSPVLVADPEPVVVPPGAEAFFESIDPVIPPQP